MTKPTTTQPTCRVAPLPKLTWSGHAWEATVTIRAWAGLPGARRPVHRALQPAPIDRASPLERRRARW